MQKQGDFKILEAGKLIHQWMVTGSEIGYLFIFQYFNRSYSDSFYNLIGYSGKSN